METTDGGPSSPKRTRERPPLGQALLRLLLGDPRIDPDDLDWSAVLPLAQKHRLVMRLTAWFALRGEPAPEPFRLLAAQAEERHRVLLDLMARIGERCGRLGVPHAFLKASQQYPDLGRDLELLIPADSPELDTVINGRCGSSVRRRSGAFLTGTTACAIPNATGVLQIHHGRIGRLGEHTRFAAQLMERSRPLPLGDVVCYSPSPEDALLLQVLSRFYRKPALRLRDVLWAITTIRSGLDWDQLLETARATGLLPGLSRYLEAVDRIHEDLLGKPLLTHDVCRRFATAHDTAPQYANDTFAIPAGVTAPLYFRQFLSDVASRDWGAAGRLALLPFVAAAAGYRRLAHPRAGGATA